MRDFPHSEADAAPTAPLDLGDASPLQVVSPSFARGDQIDHFRVISKVGEGGMGEVLKAYNPDLDRHVAIKVLKAETPDAHDRLLREAQAMAKIRHANVVTVYSVGTIQEQVYIAMEFMDRGSVRDWAARRQRDWREVLALYLKAGAGLAAVHEVGLVHRDFKPSNVLIDTRGRVLVTDFGLVSSDELEGDTRNTLERPASQPLLLTLTQSGAILGTPPYMAPEQHCSDDADARSDQFAFCVALYETLYGVRPHAGDDYFELAANILNGRIRKAPSDTKVPSWIRRILLRGMSVLPEDRYESMQPLLAALKAEPRHRNPGWVARRASAGLVVAALGVAIALAWPGQSKSSSATLTEAPQSTTASVSTAELEAPEAPNRKALTEP